MSRTLYRLSYGHAIGRGSRIRTCDIRLPKPTRYLAALCPEFGTPSGDRTRVSDLKGRRTFRCSMGAKIKNLVESHGIEPRVAWGVRFTAGWVCRILTLRKSLQAGLVMCFYAKDLSSTLMLSPPNVASEHEKNSDIDFRVQDDILKRCAYTCRLPFDTAASSSPMR